MNLRHAVLLIGIWLPHGSTVWGQNEAHPRAADLLLPTADPVNAEATAQEPGPFVALANVDESARVPGRVTAVMLLVKSDWSDAEDSDKIEEELKTLLQDSALHDSYRQNLLASASKILFSDEFVSLYERGKFAGLIGWLMKHQLVRKAIVRRESLDKDEQRLAQWNFYLHDDDGWTPLQHSAMFVSELSFPFPNMGRPDPPPFVTHTYGWAWTFVSRSQLQADGERALFEMDVVREGQRLEEIETQDSGTAERRNISGNTRFKFEFPSDRVAVLNGFLDFSKSVQRDLRLAGWEPIVYIVPEVLPLPRSNDLALAKPASLIKASTSARSRFEPNLRGGGPRQPSSPEPQPSPAEDLAVIKVFMLTYVKASEAANILTKLLPDGKYVADERVNSVVARGDKEQLEMAEALLLNLDAQPASSQQFSTPRKAEQQAKLEEVLRSLRGKYATTEQRTQSIAEALVAERDAEATKRLREQLTIVVSEAFGLRQELQKAELALLRERIHRIESQVNQRETLRDEIIRHRVDQLVSGEASTVETLEQLGSITPNLNSIEMRFDDAPWGQVLRWFADLRGVALQLNHEPTGTFSYHSPRKQTLEEARAAIIAALPSTFEMLQNEGQLIVRQRTALSRAANIPATGVTTLRSPDEYRRAFEELHKSIAQYERFRSMLNEQNPPDEDGLHLLNTIPKLKKQLEALSSEFAAQVRLFELQVGAEKVAVQIAEQAMERAKALYEGGQMSSAEMGQATLAYEPARARFDQTMTLLDLYRQAGADAQPDPPKSKAPGDKPTPDAPPDGETSRKGVTIESLPDDGILILRGEKKAVQDVVETIEQVNKDSSEPATALQDALPK